MKEKIHASTNVYKIVELLGEGAKGTVYKAEKSDELGEITTTVALKILNSDEFVEIWRREFLSLKSVRSHYCVNVFGFERVNDSPALSLEYVEGLSLAELVSHAQFDTCIIKEIGSQILIGLSDLWSQHMLHGDLSPGNILVATNGQIKLLDFGLANRMGSVRFGTPEFTAPEVLLGESEDKNADIYSLGKVLEYLAVGKNCDPELLEVIKTLTHKNRTQRKSPNWKSNRLVKERLAGVVQEAYRRKKFDSIETKEFILKSVAIDVNASKQASVNFGMLKFLRAFVLIVGVLSISLGIFLFWKNPSGKGQLRIRSSSWYRIAIDGKDYGYTPIDISDLPAGKREIQWEGMSGKGKRVLTLKTGENRLIEDSFFQSANEE